MEPKEVRTDPASDTSAPAVRPTTSDDHELGNAISEAAGGLSGVIAGAAVGSIAGPVGTLIGGVTGAVTGWWAGHALADSARRFDDEHDPEMHERFTTAMPDHDPVLADLSYDDVRPAYRIGFLAGSNPEWDRRSFDDVEVAIRQGWEGLSTRRASWEVARSFAEEGFIRARSGARLDSRAGDATGSTVDVGALSASAIAGGAIDAVRAERAETRAASDLADAPTRLI